MKKYREVIVLGLVVVAILLYMLWTNNPKEVEVSKILPNVKVMEVLTSTDQEPTKLEGIIQPKETFLGVFPIEGTINNVFVEKNQQVKRGTVLMSVNDEASQENLVKAQEAYSIALSNQNEAEAIMYSEAMIFENEKLINQNRIAQAKKEVEDLEIQLRNAIAANSDVTQLTNQLEAAKIVASYQENETPASLSIAQSRYNAAVSTYESSVIQSYIALNKVQIAQLEVAQTKLLSPIDGTVVEILQKEGDKANSQLPSIVVESHELVVMFTLSQSNINRVSEKMVVQIITEDQEFEGLISEISFIPDKTLKTYEVKVDIGLKENLEIGDTVQINVDLEETDGTWIDLNLLRNDGQDYVYIIETNRVNKRVIERLELRNNLVLVRNLNKGDLIVMEGYRNLKVGDVVNVVGETNE